MMVRMATQAGSSQTHRTQEERRAETQAKLLDATVESILESGYAQTTTRHVAALAGVSAGAMSHYFPRRVDLVAAAIERLVEQRLEVWRAPAGDQPDDPEERLSALLDHLWNEFSSPLFTVFIKAWIAAADDPELYARLAIAERRISRTITELAVQTAGELTDEPGWAGRMLVAFATVRGLALTERFEPRSETLPDAWPLARQALLELVLTSPKG